MSENKSVFLVALKFMTLIFEFFSEYYPPPSLFMSRMASKCHRREESMFSAAWIWVSEMRRLRISSWLLRGALMESINWPFSTRGAGLVSHGTENTGGHLTTQVNTAAPLPGKTGDNTSHSTYIALSAALHSDCLVCVIGPHRGARQQRKKCDILICTISFYAGALKASFWMMLFNEIIGYLQ